MEEIAHKNCRHLVGKKFGRGKTDLWIDQDYKVLREEILAATNTLISVNTLKRYFGKVNTSEHYDPQRETKNALAQYIGFKDWQSFVLENSQLLPEAEEKSLRSPVSSRFSFFQKPGRWRYGVMMVVFGLLGLVGFNWLTHRTHIPDWKFEIVNPVDSAPYTMKTLFRLGGSEKDTFSLSGVSSKILDPKDTMLSIFRSVPTYSWMNFCHNHKILKQFPVHTLSRGWELYYLDKPEKVIRVPAGFQSTPSGLGISRNWFASNALDSIAFQTSIVNFKNFALNGDRFSVEFVTLLPPGLNLCKSIIFKVYGSEKHLEYRLSYPVCPHHNFINLSETFYDGQFIDLSNIHHSSIRPTVSRLEVVNKKATLYIDGKVQFSKTYLQPVGSVKGIELIVSELGYLQSFRAWNEKNELVEDSDFRRNLGGM